VSLVSVASRHHQHRSHNSVTFHHAKAIERRLPAPAYHEIHGKHGTRVTVRNLFGNMPVRVNQRSKVVEHKAENDRLWDFAKASVAGLLLSWGGSVSLRARDIDNHVIFAFNTLEPSQTTREHGMPVSKPRSTHLTLMLSVLTQANYISINQWSSWVPVSASTPTLSIKGAISLEPAPTKSIQFISLGLRPSSANSENNELYREVNRLFGFSSFGVREDDTEAERTKALQQLGKRFEGEGYADRQLKARKGVDQYPMFHLRIALREGVAMGDTEAHFYKDETNVQAIVEVLNAMVTQWLKAHHFRSVLSRRKRKTASDSTEGRVTSSGNESTPTMTTPRTASSRDSVPYTESETTKTGAVGTLVEKQRRSGFSTSRIEKQPSRVFADWSRIKSGKADFFSNSLTLQRPGTSRVVTDLQLKYGGIDNVVYLPGFDSAPAARLHPPPLAQGSLCTLAPSREEHVQESESITADSDKPDDSLFWVDPVTKKAHVLNARTGCVMPRLSVRPTTDASLSAQAMPQAISTPALRLPRQTTNSGQTPWLDGVLQHWTNPVFRTSEQRIEQVPLQEHETLHLRHHCCSAHGEGDLKTHPITMTRLSKQSLSSAEVLAQVDNKFILVRTKACTDSCSAQDASMPLLVLIDQHAADERIRVEALFRDLCSPVVATCSSYRSKLGHSAQVASVVLEKPLNFTVSRQEWLHFTTHAGKFASWGILFDFADLATYPEKCRVSNETSYLLCIIALPPSISERCRADARLLISFLRSTVWKYASGPSLTSNPSLNWRERSPHWVVRLADCPEGLIDIINSRACRSAVMFNDQLDMSRCSKLVQGLANCVFPFICAHGRPSMVPLGDIGNAPEAFSSCTDVGKGSFVQAWKQWKQ
jgi:DNA mismatch repair protein MLH3